MVKLKFVESLHFHKSSFAFEWTFEQMKTFNISGAQEMQIYSFKLHRKSELKIQPGSSKLDSVLWVSTTFMTNMKQSLLLLFLWHNKKNAMNALLAFQSALNGNKSQQAGEVLCEQILSQYYEKSFANKKLHHLCCIRSHSPERIPFHSHLLDGKPDA